MRRICRIRAISRSRSGMLTAVPALPLRRIRPALLIGHLADHHRTALKLLELVSAVLLGPLSHGLDNSPPRRRPIERSRRQTGLVVACPAIGSAEKRRAFWWRW